MAERLVPLGWQVQIVKAWVEPTPPIVGEPFKPKTKVKSLTGTTVTALIIFQIKDFNGRVIYLEGLEVDIPTAEKIFESPELTVKYGGSYTLEVFVWKSWDNPTPLAPPSTYAFKVETTPPPPAKAKLEVHVKRAYTGEPIQGATVKVWNEEVKEAVTDAEGVAAIGELTPDTYNIQAEAPEYAANSVRKTLEAGTSYTITIHLFPLTNTGTVQGKITDAKTGEGIPEATVSIGYQETHTDANGNYRLENIEAGYRFVYATKKGYEPKGKTVEVKPGTTVTCNLSLIPKAEQQPPGTPAKAKIVDFTIPEQADIGSKVELSVTVKNIGGITGIFDCHFIADGSEHIPAGETLPPGETFKWTWTFLMPKRNVKVLIEARRFDETVGNYVVEDKVTGEIKHTGEATQPPKIEPWHLGLVAGIPAAAIAGWKLYPEIKKRIGRGSSPSAELVHRGRKYG